MAIITNPTKVITGINTRWSYANVWDPSQMAADIGRGYIKLMIYR